MSERTRDALRSAWLAALRSGEYKQGRKALRTDRGGFCCLGVLCDVIAPDGWGEAIAKDGHCARYWDGGDMYGEALVSLTERLRAAMGIDVVGEKILTSMNDAHDKTFADIADYLEAEWAKETP